MAHEVKPWKQPDCELSVPVKKLSLREGHSREISETFGEGGGLNADYQTIEAVAVASNILGERGFEYGVDFVFKTGGSDTVSFDFLNPTLRRRAEQVFAAAAPIAA
jgi:hypothetical protein